MFENLSKLFDAGFEHIPVSLPETDEKIVGYAGQLVSAILQTAGLYAQSEVLQKFGHFLDSTGALIFIFCVIGAVISWALFGNFRESLYFLIGPALFNFTIHTVVPTSGTAWQFGDRRNDSTKQTITALLDWPVMSSYGEKAPQVSWVFAEFDRVVSSVVQSLVTVLVDTENKHDLVIAARERMLSRVYASEMTETGMIQLVAGGLMGECGKYASAIHQLAQNTEAARKEKERNRAQVQELAKFLQVLDPKTRDFLEEIRSYHRNHRQAATNETEFVTQEADRLLRQVDVDGPVPESLSCDQIWTYTALAAFMVAESSLNRPQEKGDDTAIPWKEVKRQVAAALVFDNCLDGNLSADERIAKARQANGGSLIKTLPDGTKEVISGDTGTGLGDANTDAATQRKCSAQDLKKISSKATEVVAAFVIRNTINSSVFQSMAQNQNSRGSWDPAIFTTAMGRNASFEAEAKKSSIFWFAASIPYIQGVLLFFLSMAFPFFALFLLMPTQSVHFLTWLGAWVWVKSWDVGFAALFFFRDLLWQYMRGDIRSAFNIDRMNWGSPDLIFTVMFQGDPMANMQTYFHLVALFTLAIPLMTAHATLGATDLVSALGESIDLKATQFGARKGRAARRMEASGIGRYIAERQADYLKSVNAWAMRNPGHNHLGESRWWKDDSTRMRYASMVQNLAMVKFQSNENQLLHRNMLAGVTGRKMSYTAGMGGKVVEAYIGMRNEELRGPNVGQQSAWLPTFARDTRLFDESSGVLLRAGDGPSAYDQNSGDRYNQDSDGT